MCGGIGGGLVGEAGMFSGENYKDIAFGVGFGGSPTLVSDSALVTNTNTVISGSFKDTNEDSSSTKTISNQLSGSIDRDQEKSSNNSDSGMSNGKGITCSGMGAQKNGC